MGDISKNFSRSEFQCGDNCGFSTADYELIRLLEKIKRYFNNRAVIINSGCRCNDHNEAVGGSAGSKHKQGIAADIVVKGVHPLKIYQYVDSIAPDTYGIGHYPTFTHIDVRKDKGRWHG